MNMRILGKKRVTPKPGDVFAYLMPDGLYRYGRVIRVDAEVGGFPDGILVYLYRAVSRSKNEVPVLHASELLIPPVATNLQPWRLGYFEVVRSRRLEPADVLPQHCFYSDLFRKYYDEYGRELPARVEPCGGFGLCTVLGIDNRVSEALGIPFSETPVAVERGARKRRGVLHAVIVHIEWGEAGRSRGDLSELVDELETEMIKRVAQGKAGEVDGHEIALDDSDASIYLYGKSADRLSSSILPILRAARLPRGSYILKRFGEPGDREERVDL